MQRLPIVFCVILVALFFLSSAFAMPKKTPLKIRADSSKIAIEHFNQKAIDNYKSDEDFNYSGKSIGRPSLWDQFWDWVWYNIGRLFNRIPYGGSILKYVLVVACVVFLAYVIFKSLGIDPISFLRGDAAKVNVPYSELLEDINGIDFDAEIEKAAAQHNFRLAVRLLYLKCLKQLSDKGLIQWQIDKTNSAYIAELASPQQKQIFVLLTRQFEYVWYGNFAINKQAFTDIDLLFQDFKKQLP